MGRGRGRGGCQGCEAMHAFACCFCLILVTGPILLGVGSSMLAAATRNERKRRIDSVEGTANAWNNPTNPDGWQRFGQAAMWLVFQPGPAADPTACVRGSAAMRVDTLPVDLWTDEGDRFSATKQLRFKYELPYGRFVGCRMQVTLLQQFPGQAFNQTLAVLPLMGSDTLTYSILLDRAVGPRTCSTRNDACYGTNYRNCRDNCEDYWGGNFDCRGGYYYCTLQDVYYNDLAIKVMYRPASPAPDTAPEAYTLDFETPDGGAGANIMPYGFVRQYATYNSSTGINAGSLFQLPNIRPPYGSWAGLSGTPAYMSFTVRSSIDPWLSYMAVTGGSGWFGVHKSTLVVSGVVLVLIGSIGTLCWFMLAFYSWRLMCARNLPQSRPEGVNGYAWDLANRYGGQYAPAMGTPVYAPGQDGAPTAQPLYVPAGSQPYGTQSQEPAAGQPAYGYPYPYPATSYPYPPYAGGAPPPSYPPPGTNVEMVSFPPYGTAGGGAAAGGTADRDSGAGATASYYYPYAPPYGAPPPYSPAAAGPGAPPQSASARYTDGAPAAAGSPHGSPPPAAAPAPPPPPPLPEDDMRVPLTGYGSGGAAGPSNSSSSGPVGDTRSPRQHRPRGYTKS